MPYFCLSPQPLAQDLLKASSASYSCLAMAMFSFLARARWAQNRGFHDRMMGTACPGLDVGAARRWDTIRKIPPCCSGLVLRQCVPARYGALQLPHFQQLPSASHIAGATDEQWCCGQADPGLLEQREHSKQHGGRRGGSGGLQGTLGFDPRKEEPTVYSQRDLSSRQPGGADDPDFPFLFET